MRWLAVVVLLGGASARAGDGDPVAVIAKLERTTARLTVRFNIDVGVGVGANVQSLALPPGGLVTDGTAIVRGVRRPLRLVDAEVASQAFDALAHAQVTGHPAWSIVMTGSGSFVNVDVLTPIETKVELELAVEIPTCFFHAARYALVPDSWPVAGTLGVGTTPELDAACAPLGNNEGMLWIGFASKHLRGTERIGALAGRLALPDAHLARVEVDLASELGEVPRDLHTAIVIDHSRSLSNAELEEQRAVVAAYLRGAPTSRVQIIAFTRRAQALLPSWMIAAQAAPRIDRAIRALAPRNGSNVDVALAEAASWLSRTTGTKRIVLITDERLAARFERTPAVTLRAAVPAGTLVHIVVPSEGDGRPTRFDDSVLAPLAKATEGIAVRAGVDEDGAIDATMLLRPIALDKVAVRAHGWDEFAIDGETQCHELDALAAGTSCTWWGKGTPVSGPITVEGWLWNRPVARTLRPDPSQGRTLARLLSGTDVLDEPLQAQVERAALAVNVVWSLFATWGGDGGYEDLGGGGSFSSGSFGTRGGSFDHGIGTVTGVVPVDVRWQIESAVRRCRPPGPSVTVMLELTRQEIVDVDVNVEPADEAARTCISEALWDTTLVVANAPERKTIRERF